MSTTGTTKKQQEAGKRLAEERTRLGYSIPQLACLFGIETGDQESFERGESVPGYEYLSSIRALGGDPLYIMGMNATSTPRVSAGGPGIDMDFLSAVMLMRRSSQAVDAWFPEGTSMKHPEMVVALMNATIARENIGAMSIDDWVEKIAAAISGAGAEIADALQPGGAERDPT